MRLAILLSLFHTALAAAHAGVTTEERYVFYDVSGDNAFELRASINRERLALGKGFDALTSWNISWEFSYVPRQQKCKITDVTINTSIEYLLPRWPGAAAHPDRQLSARWQRYFNQLNAHELRHGLLVKEATLEIERSIFRSDDTAAAPPTCTALEALANKNARQVVNEMEQQQQLFDKVTDHGRSTGATFP